MGTAAPIERCYYYECSNGKVRLTCHIPPDELKKLAKSGKISDAALEDFPDGVDLDCTELDFKEFESDYGYQHGFTADELRNTFFAMFSSTKDWNTYRGCGLVPATELEQRISEVREKVDTDISAGIKPTLRSHSPLTRNRQIRQVIQQNNKLLDNLRKINISKIDEKRPIHEQSFRKLKMGKGLNAEVVFAKLHQKSEGA